MHHGEISHQIAQGLLALKKRITSAMTPISTLDEPHKAASCSISELVKSPCTEDAIHINHSRSQLHWSSPHTTFNARSNGQIGNRRSSCLPRLCWIRSLFSARAVFTDFFCTPGSLPSLRDNRDTFGIVLLRFALLPTLILSMRSISLAAESVSDLEKSFRPLGRALTEAQKYLDEYGSMNISTPILRVPDSNFQFALTNTSPQYFYDRAKASRQGAVGMSDSSFTGAALSFQANLQPQIAQGIALDQRRMEAQTLVVEEGLSSLRKEADLRRQAALTNGVEAERLLAQANGWSNYSATIGRAFGTNGITLGYSNLLKSDQPGFMSSDRSNLLSGLANPFATLTNQDGKFNVPERTAIITAAGDNAVHAIFKVLGASGSKDGQEGFTHSKTYFGLSTIAADPGWRTRRGWAGEVLVAVDVEWVEARAAVVNAYITNRSASSYELDGIHTQLKAQLLRNFYSSRKETFSESTLNSLFRPYGLLYGDTNTIPEVTPGTSIPPQLALKATNGTDVAVMVVSPLQDTETFDLASSIQRQVDMSLALAANLALAGMPAEAKTFFRYARDRQRDVATRTSLAAINTISGQNGLFGFQIGPRVRGTQTDSKWGGGGEYMERQSFPALLLFALNGEELRARLGWVGERLVLFEPRLRLRQFRRWIPTQERSGGSWFRPRSWGADYSEGRRLNDLLKLTFNLEKAGGALSVDPVGKRVMDGFQARSEAYVDQLGGSTDTIYFPVFDVIESRRLDFELLTTTKFSRIEPATFELPEAAAGQETFELFGENLESLSLSDIRMHPDTNAVVRLVAPPDFMTRSIRLVADIATNATTFNFVFQTTSSNGAPRSIASPPVTVTRKAPAAMALPVVELGTPSVGVEKTPDGRMITFSLRIPILDRISLRGMTLYPQTNVAVQVVARAGAKADEIWFTALLPEDKEIKLTRVSVPLKEAAVGLTNIVTDTLTVPDE